MSWQKLKKSLHQQIFYTTVLFVIFLSFTGWSFFTQFATFLLIFFLVQILLEKINKELNSH